MTQEIPLVLTSSYWSFDSILSEGKVLSKEQLGKLGIPFQQHTTSYVSLEHALGTNNDVTLFIDPLFRSDLYGGFFNLGPRMIFDRSLLYRDGVYMLPEDQGIYYDGLNERPRERYQDFERDKMWSTREKDAFIARLDIDRVVSAQEHSSFREVPRPEVHVPKEVELEFLKGCLIHQTFFERYKNRKELIGKVVVPFTGKDNSTGPPDTISLLQAYRRYLHMLGD